MKGQIQEKVKFYIECFCGALILFLADLSATLSLSREGDNSAFESLLLISGTFSSLVLFIALIFSCFKAHQLIEKIFGNE